VADWMIWVFPFDDWFDGLMGENPSEVRRVIEPMIRYLYGDSGALQPDPPPWYGHSSICVVAAVSPCHRCGSTVSQQTWQNIFTHSTLKQWIRRLVVHTTSLI
ncbi:hypothetical protein, partial [Nocardia terpenica]|uniref:hypothetical protein n=1 Tax=Nocardia terpenica TaxID=455432 RepID=UPI002FE1E5B1